MGLLGCQGCSYSAIWFNKAMLTCLVASIFQRLNMTTSRKDHANMSRDYMGVVLNKGSQELFSSVCRPTRVMFFLLIRDSDDSLVFATPMTT